MLQGPEMETSGGEQYTVGIIVFLILFQIK